MARLLGWRVMLPLAIGLLAGAYSMRWAPNYLEKQPAPVPREEVNKSIPPDLFTTISRLANDHNLRTQSDFEKRFAGYEITYPTQPFSYPGSLPLSFETEKYVAVILWRERAIFTPPPPIPEPQNWSDPNFRIERNPDGSARRNPDGSIRAQAIGDPKTMNWAPRRHPDGSYMLRQDVRTPADKLWYLLAAFNKSTDLCNWWCVVVD